MTVDSMNHGTAADVMPQEATLEVSLVGQGLLRELTGRPLHEAGGRPHYDLKSAPRLETERMRAPKAPR